MYSASLSFPEVVLKCVLFICLPVNFHLEISTRYPLKLSSQVCFCQVPVNSGEGISNHTVKMNMLYLINKIVATDYKQNRIKL